MTEKPKTKEKIKKWKKCGRKHPLHKRLKCILKTGHKGKHRGYRKTLKRLLHNWDKHTDEITITHNPLEELLISEEEAKALRVGKELKE